MKLEYLPRINAYNDSLIRLYDFDVVQASKLQVQISQKIIHNKIELDLSQLDFIESINCNLVFRLSERDIGIFTEDNNVFFCDLTLRKFEEMILIIEPFTKKTEAGCSNWLFDLNTQIELLISPDGDW